MNKKNKLWLILLLCFAVCLVLMFIFLGGIEKAPDAYTWEEYQTMDHEEKDALFERFDTLEDFEAWKESMQPQETEPEFIWDLPGKLPDAYTYGEYLTLTSEQKEAFYQWFSSVTEFESWLQQAQADIAETEPPAWDPQGKQPDEYSWSEYQALTPEEQDAFYLWFSSREAFETWIYTVNPPDENPTEPSWDVSGKTPNEYTWLEYQALSPEQQDAFYLWFDSLQAFEDWMISVQPTEAVPETDHWDKPGKQPNEYTLEEYQALSPEEQDLFYLWFDSRDEFEMWLSEAGQE